MDNDNNSANEQEHQDAGPVAQGEADESVKNEHEHKPERGEGGKGKGKRRTVLVRYGKMGNIGLFRHSEREIPPTSNWVIVNTERGLEMGHVVSACFHQRGTCGLSDERVEEYCKSSGNDYPLNMQGRFVRFATEQDLNEQRHLEKGAVEEATYCREQIEKHELPMDLVDVEHLFGGDRIIYYFMSDGRVDFRALVRELAHRYQTRIEMRQVGARDEARLLADYETCGQPCCCRVFLKVLQPVNMRMAKLQKATLDPTKISGRCGRLKCCLRYEDQVYTELAKKLPRRNMRVLTSEGAGVIIGGQVLTQLVEIVLDDNRRIAISVDEILEKDYKPGEQVERPVEVQSRQRRPERRSAETKPAEEQPAVQTEGSDGQEQPKKKRRRRRRKRKDDGGGEDNGGGQNGSSDNSENA